MEPKTRGAPRGNRNALKHGFYSAAFKDRERRLLSQPSAVDLSTEIELLRVVNYRFLQGLLACSDQLDAKTRLAAIRAVNLSVLSIKRLLNARSLIALTSSDDSFALDGPEALPELSPGASGGSHPAPPTGESEA